MNFKQGSGLLPMQYEEDFEKTSLVSRYLYLALPPPQLWVLESEREMA